MPYAWIWTRTAPCPNPACRLITPLANSWKLSAKRGAEVFVRPLINSQRVDFEVTEDAASVPAEAKTGRAEFRCVRCQETLSAAYLRGAANEGKFDCRLLAIAAMDGAQRTYLSPTAEQEQGPGLSLDNDDFLRVPVAEGALGIQVPIWGLNATTRSVHASPSPGIDRVCGQRERSRRRDASARIPDRTQTVDRGDTRLSCESTCDAQLDAGQVVHSEWPVEGGPSPAGAEPAAGLDVRGDKSLRWFRRRLASSCRHVGSGTGLYPSPRSAGERRGRRRTSGGGRSTRRRVSGGDGSPIFRAHWVCRLV